MSLESRLEQDEEQGREEGALAALLPGHARLSVRCEVCCAAEQEAKQGPLSQGSDLFAIYFVKFYAIFGILTVVKQHGFGCVCELCNF